MTPLVLLSLSLSSALCLATPLESAVHKARVSEPSMRSNATTCPTCVLAKSSSATQSVFPWLFNNNNARFMYARTDDEGWPVYQYFYNINDLEDGYEEADGRVYIYNSDSDDCVEDTGRNWYYWSTNRWIYDESIYMQQC